MKHPLARSAAVMPAPPSPLRHLRFVEGEAGGGSSGDQGGDDGDDGQDGSDGDDGDGDDGEATLGDAGKQALDRMKTERNEARRNLRAFSKLGLTPEQIVALRDGRTPGQRGGDQGSDGGEVDLDAVREEARREVRLEAARDRVGDRIEAKARAFADPTDAVAILLRDRGADDFLDGDRVDVEAIEEALTELLEKKPHLAAQGGRRFGGSGDGGKRQDKKPDPGPGVARLRAAYSTT